MPNQAKPASVFIALTCLAAGLSGCAGGSPLSGRRIVDDLERARISVPDEVGAASRSEGEAKLPAARPITLADLLSVAEARSHSLAAARSGVGIAAGQRWQASLYPNPRSDVLVEDISSNDGLADAKTTVGVVQPIILGNRRGAAIDAADARQAVRMAEVEVARRAIFGDICLEHARLLSIREREQLYGELRELADRTLTAATTRFEARAVPETDVIRPRVEVHRLNAAIERLAQEKAASARRLGLLIGGVAVDPDRLGGTVESESRSIDVEALQAVVRATHPTLMVADREIVATTARLEQVRAERTPDLDVRVAAGYRGESDDGIVEVGVGITLPIWDAGQGDLLSARFEVLRARQQRAAMENDLLAKLASAAGEYEAARAQFTTFRDQIVPDAQRAFEQTGEGYKGGRTNFLDVLDSQRTLTEVRITLAELASALATARASIIQVVGPDGLRTTVGVPSPASEPSVPSSIEVRPQGAEVKP